MCLCKLKARKVTLAPRLVALGFAARRDSAQALSLLLCTNSWSLEIGPWQASAGYVAVARARNLVADALGSSQEYRHQQTTSETVSDFHLPRPRTALELRLLVLSGLVGASEALAPLLLLLGQFIIVTSRIHSLVIPACGSCASQKDCRGRTPPETWGRARLGTMGSAT